ncbi:MAG TPA: allantoinase AllB [bacterium]|nr:allantoinase AllB [bacterium]
MLDTVIRGGRVVRPTGVEVMDIGIEGGKVAALEPEVTQAARKTVDARGMHVFPGVLDAHVHFNDPGRASWEGVPSGSAALAAGGGTCFIDMPLNSSPPTLDADSFDRKLQACRGRAFTDFALWGGLTPDNLDHLEALAERGVVGFKAFMSGSGMDDFRRCDDESLYKGMRIAAGLGLPVLLHAEDEAMTSELAAAAREEGRAGVKDFLDSRPIEAEARAIARAIRMASETRCSIHIVHTSSSWGVQLVRNAVQAEQCQVTCETCPHYLLLSAADVMRVGAPAKCAPPLRPEVERQKLVRDVAEGRVDTIGSDHSPSPPSMKRGSDFFSVWGGISGVQATLRALLTLDIPAHLISRMTAENVARLFRLPGKGGIRVGGDADLSIVNVAELRKVFRSELLDRHRLSPYAGRPLRGAVRRSVIRGVTVFLDGRIMGEPSGIHLRPVVT